LLVFAYALPGWGNERVLPYQLEVYLNGQPTQQILGFEDQGEGRFAAQPYDLESIGVAISDEVRNRTLVPLSEFGTYRYDEPYQRLYLEIAATRLKPSILDARGSEVRTEPARAGHGALSDANFDVHDAHVPQSGRRRHGDEKAGEL
jgi:outer membrane usher protein FimD/PapC